MKENRTAGLDSYKLYSLTELEPILGVTHRTLLNYVKDGKLRAKKIGGKWRVTEQEVKRFTSGNQ